MSPYRCVILGCGPRARWHARAYAHLSRGELVACCDRHPSVASVLSASSACAPIPRWQR